MGQTYTISYEVNAKNLSERLLIDEKEVLIREDHTGKLNVGSGQKSIFFKRNSYPLPTAFYIEAQGNQVFADMLPLLHIRLIVY